MAITTLLFDVDGTLLDSNALHVEAWREAFAVHGHVVQEEQLRKNIGKGGDTYVPSVLGNEIEEREGDRLRELHTQLYLQKLKAGARINVFPEVVQTLLALRERGVQLVIATSSKKKELAATSFAAGIEFQTFVDEVVTGDHAKASKPAPDIVAVAVEKAKVAPSQCRMVGDTPYDGQSAAGAGVSFIGVTCGGCFDEGELRKAGAVQVYSGLQEMGGELDRVLS